MDSILELIPQRAPIVMVNEFVGIEGNVSRTRFAVYNENIFVDNGCLSECGLIEHIAQSAAARVGYIFKSNNQPIPLELHHIDGNHHNNSLSNLQILCPNCHAQQSNNSGKAVGSYAEAILQHKQKIAERERKVAEAKAAKLIKNPEKVDSFGRVNERMLTQDEWQHRKELILTSGVDLTKFGWKTKVQTITGLTRRQVDDVVEHFFDELSSRVYLR
jgi:predicted hotdog family 3-hydroxylacyl-ACP dehydratase